MKRKPIRVYGDPGVAQVPTRESEDFVSTHVAQYATPLENRLVSRPGLDHPNDTFAGRGPLVRDPELSGRIIKQREIRFPENPYRTLQGGRSLNFGSEPGSNEALQATAFVEEVVQPTCTVRGDFASVEDGDDSSMDLPLAITESLMESKALLKIAKKAPTLPPEEVLKSLDAYASKALFPAQEVQKPPRQVKGSDLLLIAAAAFILGSLTE